MKAFVCLLIGSFLIANQFNFKEVYINDKLSLVDVKLVIKDDVYQIYYKDKLMDERFIILSCKQGFCLVENVYEFKKW